MSGRALAAPGIRDHRDPDGEQALLGAVRLDPLLGADRLIGTSVLLTVIDARVRIVEAFTGEVAAEHP